MKNNTETYRFKLGRKHGADDNKSGVVSDMGWFKRNGFWAKDKEYCAGYELGYLEADVKKK